MRSTHPTIDRPQIRDLQYLVTDGDTFFRDERQLANTHECLDLDTLGYRITNTDPEGRYRILKEVITDPHQDCVLIHTHLEADAAMLARMQLFALLSPHLEAGGRGNNGSVVQTSWGKCDAHKSVYGVLGASIPLLPASCGYVGEPTAARPGSELPDGLEFVCEEDGNIALTGRWTSSSAAASCWRLPWGHSSPRPGHCCPSPGPSFAGHRTRFIEQCNERVSFTARERNRGSDDGSLDHASNSIIRRMKT